MNKKRIIYLFLWISLLFQQDIHAQAQSYGSAKIELAADVTASSDGLILLSSAQNNSANFDFWTVFVDTSGNFLSEKRFGGQQKEMAAKVVPTTNGHFIFGTTYSSELTNYKGNGDFLLIKMDITGNEIWRKLYGGSKLDNAIAMTATNDGGAILVGMTHSADLGNQSFGQADVLLIKVDANGNTQWTQSYGGSQTDYPSDIQITSDGGFILSGTTFSQDGNITSNAGQSDIWALKLSTTGDIQWSKSFGSIAFDYGHAIKPTDGGYILVGAIGSINPNQPGIEDRYDQDLTAIKLDESGQVVWQKILGLNRYDAGLDVHPMNDDSGFLITGYSEVDDFGAYPYGVYKNAWTLKLDLQGNKLWELYSTGSNNEYGTVIGLDQSQTVVAVLGDTDSKNGNLISSGKKDLWLSKYSDQALPFSVFLGNDFGICPDKTIFLNATVSNCPNCSYIWEDNSVEAIRSIKVTETKEYVVTVTNSAGQTTTDAIIISVFSQPTASISKNHPFVGDNNGHIIVTPQNGTPDYSIQWDHGPTEFFINQLTAGEYHFLLTDHNGCTVDSTIMLQSVVANQELAQKKEITIFPNPIQEYDELQIQSSEAIKSIAIFNNAGHFVRTANAPQDLQLDHLPKGVYYLHFHLKNGQSLTKSLEIF